MKNDRSRDNSFFYNYKKKSNYYEKILYFSILNEMSEEGTDPISFSTFSYFFDKDKRLVKEHEFRQAVFRSKLSIKNSKIKLYLIFFYRRNRQQNQKLCLEIFVPILCF
jgi:hypothetical protein